MRIRLVRWIGVAALAIAVSGCHYGYYHGPGPVLGGAAVGAAAGAVGGAIVGAPGVGAAVGAAAGSVIGAAGAARAYHGPRYGYYAPPPPRYRRYRPYYRPYRYRPYRYRPYYAY